MEFNNQYLTYVEYRKLGGALEETPFNILEFKARKIIDKYTFGRLIDLETQVQEVKICMYELMNSLTTYFTQDGMPKSDKQVSSENIDGYNVTYSNFDENLLKANVMQIKGIINSYLSECKTDKGIPYLYRGADKNEK